MNAYVTVLALSEVGRIWEIRNSATSPSTPTLTLPHRGGGDNPENTCVYPFPPGGGRLGWGGLRIVQRFLKLR